MLYKNESALILPPSQKDKYSCLLVIWDYDQTVCVKVSCRFYVKATSYCTRFLSTNLGRDNLNTLNLLLLNQIRMACLCCFLENLLNIVISYEFFRWSSLFLAGSIAKFLWPESLLSYSILTIRWTGMSSKSSCRRWFSNHQDEQDLLRIEQNQSMKPLVQSSDHFNMGHIDSTLYKPESETKRALLNKPFKKYIPLHLL